MTDKNSKQRKKGFILRNPKQVATITDRLFTSTGVRSLIEDNRGEDFIEYKDSKGQDVFRIETKELFQSIKTTIKTTYTQKKNFYALMIRLQKENLNRADRGELKENFIRFKFSDYLAWRGYSKDEIKRGGGFISNKLDELITGALVKFTATVKPYDKPEEWIVTGFYDLRVTIENDPLMTVTFSEFLMDLIRSDSYEFFPIREDLITDRRTEGSNAYMFNFCDHLLRYKSNNPENFRPILKIETLASWITSSDRLIKRGGQDLYKKIVNCLIYANDKQIIGGVRWVNPKTRKEIKGSAIKELRTINFDSFRNSVFYHLKIDHLKDLGVRFTYWGLKDPTQTNFRVNLPEPKDHPENQTEKKRDIIV